MRRTKVITLIYRRTKHLRAVIDISRGVNIYKLRIHCCAKAAAVTCAPSAPSRTPSACPTGPKPVRRMLLPHRVRLRSAIRA